MLTHSKYFNIYKKPLPLHNILAEEIVIGYLLSGTQLINTVIQSINAYFFSLKKYQILYLYIYTIKTKNKTQNLIEVTHKLWDTKLLHEMGGIYYILDIIQKSQTLYISYNRYEYLKYFLDILHYYYIKRLFIQYSNTIIQINYFYNLSIQAIYKLSISYLNTIADISKINKFHSFNQDIKSFLCQINQSTSKKNRILSGFTDLDKVTNGFQNGDLVIIAGRPSMGKTSFAINILYQLSIKLKILVHMFSLEMSKNEILDKLIALITNISLSELVTKSIKQQDWSKIQKTCQLLMHSPILIDDNGYSSINYIKSQCQDYKKYKNIIIIDYLQLINIENDHIENRVQEIGNITRELKLLAQNIKSTIIVLSQLNRNIENRVNKRPLLSDLRESGCIEYRDLPKIEIHLHIQFTETLQYSKKKPILNRINDFSLYENLTQFVFLIINQTTQFISTTHNHKLLSYHTWKKEDQVKYNQISLVKPSNWLNSQLIIELNKLLNIKRLTKSRVYDLTIKNYHNFTINNYIVHNSIEQDADLILMLYKEDANNYNKIIDIIIAKHRHGPTGAFQLLFYADTCKFNNIEKHQLFS